MKKRKIKKKALFSLIVIGIFIGLFFFSGIKIINYLRGNYDNKVIQKELLERVSKKTTPESDEIIYDIDFKTLKKQNVKKH